MKAKKKPIQTFKPEDLGVDFTPQIEILRVTEPPARIGGGKVANVDELIGKLKEAGIV
jgi:electron transfer flavoprotein beta subunit